jgi:hypothetical protein
MSELKELLQEHIKDNQAFQKNAIEKLSAIETHNKYTHERLDKIEIVGDDYKKHKNIIYGTIVSLSAVWGFFIWLFKRS